MSESITTLLLLKEIFKRQDFVQYIIKFYITLLHKMEYDQLFFKCSCQKMTRLVKNGEAVYHWNRLSIEYPPGMLSFFKGKDIDSFGSFMQQLSKETMRYFRPDFHFITKCEYCEKIWFNDYYDQGIDYMAPQTPIMILCKCGKFGAKFPCGGKKCTIVKC